VTEVAGQVAVVTGAAGGIGYALAAELVAAGCPVVMVDIEKDALAAASSELSAGGPVLAVECDVGRPEDWEVVARRTAEVFGDVGIVCLNAGVSPSGSLLSTSEATWRWLVDVNLFGVVNGLTTFGPGLLERGAGHVVLTGSAAGYIPTPGLGAYSVVKHALSALAEVLRSELSGTGVGVSLICPGPVRTGITASERNRPADRPGPSHTDPMLLERYAEAVGAALDPSSVARATVAAIGDDRFFVLPSPEVVPMVLGRLDDLAAELRANE